MTPGIPRPPSPVRLVTLDPEIEASLAGDPSYLEALGHGDWAAAAAVVHRRLGRVLSVEPASIDRLAWGGYFAVDPATREIVGTCAFKSPPDDDGFVELAYFTYPEFEGRGFATAMASKLVALAFDSPLVRAVVAHTLPRESASTTVLRRIGMSLDGEVNDPEDGTVWRWSVANPNRRPSQPSA